MDQPKAPIPFRWKPFRVRIYYVCADMEVHETSGWSWAKRMWFRKDRALFPATSILSLVNGFGTAQEVDTPTNEEGEPVLQ